MPRHRSGRPAWEQPLTSQNGKTHLPQVCVDDGPSPEANQLPVDRSTEVRVLAPYFYR